MRAIYGAPERRCWVERGQSTGCWRQRGGAIAGAIIGGILGHQIGGGRGQDIATAGGAVAGAAIGSGAGGSTYGRNYRRCETSVAGYAGVLGCNLSLPWHRAQDTVVVSAGNDHHRQRQRPAARLANRRRHNKKGPPSGGLLFDFIDAAAGFLSASAWPSGRCSALSPVCGLSECQQDSGWVLTATVNARQLHQSVN